MGRKVKILIGLVIAIILVDIYFFILPPRVIDTIPSHEKENIVLNEPLIIKFDKPVKRQKIQHFIIPEAHGEWRFEDPIMENHLYRTLVFVPAIDFKPDTKYQVKLENITSPLGIGPAHNFSFVFTTTNEAISQVDIEPEAAKEPKPKITLLDISLDWQDYPLSCEAASLKMALAYKGVYVSEDEIMEKIGYDLTPRKENIWGDPYQTYVGKVDGKICSTGFGVYWEPVAKAAQNWRPAQAFFKWNLESLIKEIKSGNPVMVWGTLPVETLHDCSWSTPAGKYIKAFRETHVRLVVGFIGDFESPSKIILNDPLSGKLYWSTSYFLTNWGVFDYAGVVIR